jgi:hypothetical protein
MFRSRMRTVCTIAVLAVFAMSAGTAEACPSCKNANATDSRLPLAYQASILFMLTVPATLVSVLGVMLYRLNKAQVLATEAFENGDVWHGQTELGTAT